MLLSLISSLLLILSFPNFNLNYLAFVAFVLLFFAIQNKSPKRAFLISYLCGFSFYLGALYWLYHVTVVGLIALCLYLALYFGIFGLLFTAFTLYPSLSTLILIPLSWTILEYTQAHLFTGFGWLLLGYSQYKNLPLIQIADFSGVYGVSFVIMMVNIAIYRMFKKSYREMIVAVMVLVIAVGYGVFRIDEDRPKESIKVSVIQGNIPQEAKWDPAKSEDILNKYIKLTHLAAFDNPDLIIWPETSFPDYFDAYKEMTQSVLALARGIKIPILLGTNTIGPSPFPSPQRGKGRVREDYFNSAVLISEKGEITGKYDKIHLVPFGEYVPFSDRFPFLRRLVLGELGEFTAGKEYKVFTLRTPNSKLQTNFAALICFEDIFPEISKKFVQNGAQFLVVITNDAWYGISGAAYQHAACSVFRAIENRVPVVRCANTGYSCFIDSCGRIYDHVEKDNVHLFITGHKTSNINLF